MKRMVLVTGSVLAVALSGCEEPVSREADLPPPVEATPAPAAEDAATSASDTAAPADQPPPLDNAQLPPANPSSEESVQPQSETLFY
ncbi:MAG: hypothetical protein K2X61_02935 [Caulobacteraceae bacterium]|nr:hypothetical protein [Caulobacteraceae bacterium]